MKKIISTVCLLCLFGAIHAQAFKIGENRSAFGVGFGWTFKERLSNSLHLPSPNASVERSIIPFKDIGFISVGAQFGFHYGYHNGTVPLTQVDYKQSWTHVYFLPRFSLYYHEFFDEDDFPSNIDLYAGIGLGFNYLSHDYSPDVLLKSDRNGFNLGYNFFAGARYYFKPNAAVFGELGYGLSFLNVGLTIRY